MEGKVAGKTEERNLVVWTMMPQLCANLSDPHNKKLNAGLQLNAVKNTFAIKQRLEGQTSKCMVMLL